MMKKLALLSVFAAMFSLFSCDDGGQRNAEPLVDPWLRDRTPVAFRLEGQVGNPVIANDWRDDTKGSVSVVLLTGTLDMANVVVDKIELAYSGATSSVATGGKVNLSGGSAVFTITAANGETRDYTLTYSAFEEPFEGVYNFDPRGGILDGGAPQCSFVVIGGYDDNIVMSTAVDKWWQWPSNGDAIVGENDNTVSIKLHSVDSETGLRSGTAVNTAGGDGLYADFMYQSNTDVSGFYRIIPKGKSRWTKDESGVIRFYDYDTEALVCECGELATGTHAFWEKSVSVANYALYRTFEGPFNDYSDSGDGRWLKNNIRNTFTLLKKVDDAPLSNHDDLLDQ